MSVRICKYSSPTAAPAALPSAGKKLYYHHDGP